MKDHPPRPNDAEDPAPGYLAALKEETMVRAWGGDKPPEYRRRVVSAAVIFGRQLETRMSANPPDSGEAGIQRFLMALMNSVISEFAAEEGLPEEAATGFLGAVETRDHVLEFNEVLEEFHEDPGRTLDEHLASAVEDRRERAIWSQHWSSG
ncbi:MAG: hypothetical protein WA990_05545 [Rubrobacteraceae bacterium]